MRNRSLSSDDSVFDTFLRPGASQVEQAGFDSIMYQPSGISKLSLPPSVQPPTPAEIPGDRLNFQQLLIESRKYQNGICLYRESLRSKFPRTPRDDNTVAFLYRVLMMCNQNDPRDEAELRAAYDFILKNNRDSASRLPSLPSRSNIYSPSYLHHLGWSPPAQHLLLPIPAQPQSAT